MSLQPHLSIDDPKTDGRHQRSERSREKIVMALIALWGQGKMEPSQLEVAEQAKVSLRTVSRHFEDMETLYEVCVKKIESQLLDKYMAPFESQDWKDRIVELVERRMIAYEEFLPYRVFSSVHRFRSRYLQINYDHVVATEVSLSLAVLPAHLKRDEAWANAFESAVSFDVWRRMRQDRGLGRSAARAAVMAGIDALLAVAPEAGD